MVTFKATVKKEKMRKDKTWKVLIRVTHGNRSGYIPTSMYVSRKEMTASFRIKDREVLERCEALIREYRRRADSLSLELNDIPIGGIVERLKEKSRGGNASFTEYAEGWMAGAKIKGVKNYRSALNALKRFLGKGDILFSDVTVAAMRAFEASLAGKPRAQSLYTNSIARMFNDARDLLNDEECGVVQIRHSLRKYKPPRQNVAEKRALGLDGIVAIMRLPDTGARTKDGNVCLHDLARDCFLLSFFLMGMNTADLYAASDFDGEFISYQRVKTKDRRADHALIRVRVHPCLSGLLEKYRGKCRVFNFSERYATASSFNRAVNAGLKEVGAAVGIPGLQFYAARHSMATAAVNEVGISKYVVNEMLNHLDPSMRVTELYVKKDFAAINDANALLAGYVLGKAGVGTVVC